MARGVAAGHARRHLPGLVYHFSILYLSTEYSMLQATTLVDSLKRELKARGIPCAELAARIDMSSPHCWTG